ncbi:MAG: hypothetical protein ACO1OG_05575 [Devosia sp.]
MIEAEETPRRRMSDTSNADARRAIADTVGLFSGWRSDLARFNVKTERRFSTAERLEMLERCAGIAGEVQEARVALLEDLMEAPRRVVGHSRVADVEKALDGVEATLAEIERRLQA